VQLQQVLMNLMTNGSRAIVLAAQVFISLYPLKPSWMNEASSSRESSEWRLRDRGDANKVIGLGVPWAGCE
jgi:hypothetical protein